MNTYSKILYFLIILGALIWSVISSATSINNKTLASQTIDPGVLKKSHQALCEQMGMQWVDPNQGEMVVAPGTQDAVLCAGGSSNDSMFKTLQHGASILRQGQTILEPIPLEEIERLNNLPLNEKS